VIAHKLARQAVNKRLVERIQLEPLRKQVLDRLVEQHMLPHKQVLQHILVLEHKQALNKLVEVFELEPSVLVVVFELEQLFVLEQQLFEQEQLFAQELAQGHWKLFKLVVVNVSMVMFKHKLVLKRIKEQLKLVWQLLLVELIAEGQFFVEQLA
jgi:hypothetical protein